MLNPDKPVTFAGNIENVENENREQSDLRPSREIGPEHSLPAQIRLMEYMIPSELRSLVIKSNGEDASNADELFLVWNECFSSDFRAFWDTDPSLSENQERLERVMLETEDNQFLTEDDFAVIVASFSPEKKGLFLTKVKEILLKEAEMV